MDLSQLGLAVSVLTGKIFLGKKRKNRESNGFCAFCSVPVKVNFTEEVIKAMIIYLDQQPNKTLRRVNDEGYGFEISLKDINPDKKEKENGK